MNGRFVIVEGLDFVGKTTLAKLVAQKLGGIYYNTPPEPFIAECIEIDKNGVSFDQKRFDFFVKTVIYASGRIKEMITNYPIVVVDRWIWTTFAYHFAGNKELHNKYKSSWQDITAPLLKPDWSILVYISDEAIWKTRRREREVSNCDQVILTDSNLRRNIFNFFLEFNPDFRLVDNSGSIEQSMLDIMDLLL